MNIFFLSENPVEAAPYYYDSHCRKIILELAIMLSAAHHLLEGEKNVYKLAWQNHPMSKWVRENKTNYIWAYNMFCALCDEFKYRFGKIHKTDITLRTILQYIPENISQSNQFTKPPLCMPDEYKKDNYIDAYRNYYVHGKKHLIAYTNRTTPSWFKNYA